LLEVHVDLEGRDALVIEEHGEWSRMALIGLFVQLYLACVLQIDGPPAKGEEIPYNLPFPEVGVIRLAEVRGVRVMEDGKDVSAAVLEGRVR